MQQTFKQKSSSIVSYIELYSSAEEACERRPKKKDNFSWFFNSRHVFSSSSFVVFIDFTNIISSVILSYVWLWIKISYTILRSIVTLFTFFWIKIQQWRKVKKECLEAKIHSALEPPRLYIFKWFFWFHIFFFLFSYCRCSSLTLIMMHCNYHKVLNLEAYKWSSFTNVHAFYIKTKTVFFAFLIV